MDSERTEAIVLRTQPVTESSLLVTWFTLDWGKLKTLAKGARRPKSPLRGKIDLFYHDEIVFLPSKRSDLHLLHDCFLENAHPRLRDSVESLTAASYAAELVEVATVPEDRNEKVFHLLLATLDALESGPGKFGVLLLWFELQLLAVAGWAPKWTERPGAGKLLASLAAASVTAAGRVRLSDAQLAEARRLVWGFWDEHVGKSPRSRAMLAREIGH